MEQPIQPRSVTLPLRSDPEQYSDKVTITVTLSPDQINGQAPATGAVISIGTQEMGAVILSPVDGILTGTLADVSLLETSPTGQMAPGSRSVTAEFTGTDPNFDVEDGTTTLTISKEDARATYTGALFASTSSATSSSATVTLAATIQDITAVDPVSDPDAGDIRNADVMFVNRDAGNSILCTASVGLVNPSDTKTGTATCNWNANIGSADSTSYTVGIIVNNYYTRDATADNTVVTVSKPLGTNFITGGGYLVLSNSAGQKAGDDGTKNNFGFNVKFNKAGTNLQGNINTIIRRTEPDGLHVYQVKGNAMSSLLATPTAKPTAATFNGKANIRDITDPLDPKTVDGNAALQVTMKDNGEPGSTDTIGITVWNKAGGLWYSSAWDGVKTVEQTIDGGNLVVH